MDKQTDKQIADKINSLDTLPQGYAPDLESKWELLQLADKKEKPAVILFLTNRWLAAAACLLLFCTAGLWWLMQPVIKTTSPIAIKKTEHVKNISSTHKVTVTENPIKIFPAIKSAKHKDKSIIEKQPGLIHDENLIATAITPPLGPGLTIVKEEILHQEPVADEPESKAKKQRYVQMDFDDNIIQPGERNISAQSVRFRFSFGNAHRNNQSFENESTLKLKQNF
ncbi:MAG: hypothetical protein ABI723_21630 [Bacteroidia bacterium]